MQSSVKRSMNLIAEKIKKKELSQVYKMKNNKFKDYWFN